MFFLELDKTKQKNLFFIYIDPNSVAAGLLCAEVLLKYRYFSYMSNKILTVLPTQINNLLKKGKFIAKICRLPGSVHTTYI